MLDPQHAKIHTPDWVRDAIFYQIFPDRFAKSERVPKNYPLQAWDVEPTYNGFKGGDLLGVVEHLDYLQDLGINAIYFNPVFASASNHRYHTYDFYRVDPLLGGNAALREVIDAAHARNMRVILDGVFNHASRGFWQFHHVLENRSESPYVDWFHFNPNRLSGEKHFAAYPDPESQRALNSGMSSYDAIGYHAWWNLPALPKFNTQSPAVREFLWNVATYWIEFGIDGWRLDVPAEINDPSFWQEFHRRVRAINPEAYLVGEMWHEAQDWLRGDRFDAVMNYLVTRACLGFFGDKLNLQELHRVGTYRDVHKMHAREFAEHIDHNLRLYDPAITYVQLNLLDSHDTPRFLTSVSGDLTALRLALFFMFTYPGAPCIYYGDEIGLDGGHDPASRKAFLWDQARWNHDLLTFAKQCIALRKTHPALRRGTYERLYAEGDVYIFARQHESETLVVALNAASLPQTVHMKVETLGLQQGAFTDLWSDASYPVANGIIRGVTLAARSGLVLKYNA